MIVAAKIGYRRAAAALEATARAASAEGRDLDKLIVTFAQVKVDDTEVASKIEPPACPWCDDEGGPQIEDNMVFADAVEALIAGDLSVAAALLSRTLDAGAMAAVERVLSTPRARAA